MFRKQQICTIQYKRSIFSLSSRFQKEAFGYVKNDLIRNLWMNLEEYFEVKRFWITVENKEKELKQRNLEECPKKEGGC